MQAPRPTPQGPAEPTLSRTAGGGRAALSAVTAGPLWTGTPALCTASPSTADVDKIRNEGAAVLFRKRREVKIRRPLRAR